MLNIRIYLNFPRLMCDVLTSAKLDVRLMRGKSLFQRVYIEYLTRIAIVL